ncbi:MAG: lipocalin-like domain-containing protein [Muribaculaceae bacterium]|nr:lipocalin-like domain-containing protein [Muribaculaceae bacterium]
MKKIYSALIVLSFMLLCGCTQYNGHIGPVFGSWSLVAMTEDGVPIALEDETVFSFQNEVVQVVKLVNPPFSVLTRYGNFKIEDDVMTLRFQSAPTSSDSYMYMAPDWLHFPQDASQIRLEVRKLNGSEMTLNLDSEGKTIGYSFKKTW